MRRPILAENKSDLQTGDGNIPKMRMGEVGTIGLNTVDGEVLEQIRKELQWPRVINTYKTMMNDPMIFAAISFLELMIAKVGWEVKAPENATEDTLKKTKFIKECMGDMEHSWESFIKEISSYIAMGFSVHEKVYRRRNGKSGSKYSDNLVGWRKLATRSQDTISRWEWSEDGRTLTAVYQDLNKVSNGTGNRFDYFFNNKDKHPEGLKIKRDKFLLFRYNTKKDSPIGNSPLNACYMPFKFRSAIEEQEAIGVSRDLGGMPVLGLHPKYMSPDATEEDKAVFSYYKNVIRNIHTNEQAGLIYPLMYNDAGKKIIEFDLMSSSGSKQYDCDAIVKRYDDKILTALFADILKLGQQSHGSFSLAGAKTNIVAMNIEARLKEIAEVINTDLIPQTFKLNGWKDTELPQIIFEDLDEEDLDEFGKLIQRVASVGFLPKDKEIVQEIVKRSGFDNPNRFTDMPEKEFKELFPEPTSKAGEGKGTSGTGDSQSGGSNSDNNSNNAS